MMVKYLSYPWPVLCPGLFDYVTEDLILSGTPLEFVSTKFLKEKPSFETFGGISRRDELGNILPVFIFEVLYVSLLLEGIGEHTPLE